MQNMDHCRVAIIIWQSGIQEIQDKPQAGCINQESVQLAEEN